MTLGNAGTNNVGCNNEEANKCSTALTDDDFSYGSTPYTVHSLYLGTIGGLNPSAFIAFRVVSKLGSDVKTGLGGLTLIVDGAKLTVSSGTPSGVDLNFNNRNPIPTWTSGETISVCLTTSGVDSCPVIPSTATTGPVDPTQRSWPLTAIEDDDPTEWWFPIGRGTCDMKDEIRPWTWKRWKAPTAEKCGWISIPDVRSDLEEPVKESAFKVYTALISSPDIDGRARVNRPRGPSVKLAVWAVYPRKYDGRTVNATRRLKGPYEDPITVCLPGSEGQAIHGYDSGEGKWVVLESVEAERKGHVCGLHKHDLGLLVVAGKPSP